MTETAKQPKDSIEEYTWMCNTIFGTFLDAIRGFNNVKYEAEELLKKTQVSNESPPFMLFFPKDLVSIPETLSDDEMRALTMNMQRADKIAGRNSPDGVNSQIMAHMTLITIFHYWEDKYRKQIATEFGLSEPNDLKVDGIGDIRLLRISIVHKNGVAKKEVEKTKRFQWFKEGDYINLDYDKMLEIKNYIMNEFRAECLNAIEAAKG